MDSKFISGYEGKYSIYEDGRIFSHVRGRFLKPVLNRGYMVVSFGNGSKDDRSQFKVHRLLMMTFKPVDNMDKLTVNHINGIRDDNRLDNLEWCSIHDNNEHALKTKLNRGKNKLVDSQVIEIKREIELLKPNTIRYISETIAPKYGVSWRTIESIVCGKRWNHKHISPN